MSDKELLRGLERATWRVGATTNDADLFALVLEAAADVGYDSASLMVYDRESDALVIRAAKGEDIVGTKVPSQRMAILANDGGSDGVVLRADSPARVLLIAGTPLDEPITQYGPFVMNTKEEITQAVADYQAGKFAPTK